MPPLSHRLFTAPDWRCGFEPVVLAWLRNAAIAAGNQSGIAAAIVPTRGDAYFFKAAALGAGLDLFGVHLMTPSEAREFLRQARGVSEPAASRAQLRLLAATAAEATGGEAAAAVASAPEHLLRAMDLLGAGGWSFAKAGPEPLRPIVREFERLLAQAGLRTAPQLDAALRDAAPEAPPLFRSLLVTGFDGAHWPWWPMLSAAAHSAIETTVLLREPQIAAADLDRTWIGAWEQEFGASESVSAEPAQPGARREFLAGADTLEQARAIVQKALQFLAEPGCERLGILLPGPGALARRVSELLAGLSIPHLDGIPHIVPGEFESAAWPAWLAFQESPRLPPLLRFLEASPSAGGLFDGLPVSLVAAELRRTQNDILLDDLDAIAEWLRRHSTSKFAGPLAHGLAGLTRLSEKNRGPEFLAETRAAFARLGWTQHAGEMQRAADGWLDRIDAPISRRAWLRWLAGALVSTRASRHAEGNHPYSRTHLLPHGQAGAQTWSHLIAAGLNEGQWPPAFEEAGWLGEREIDEMNRKVRRLNESATVQGRQGEGHETVAPGHALCLGPAQRRALAERDFFAAIETTAHAVAASVSLSDEAAPDRALNPGDFFNRLHHQATGRIVSHDGLGALRRRTAEWLSDSELWARAGERKSETPRPGALEEHPAQLQFPFAAAVESALRGGARGRRDVRRSLPAPFIAQTRVAYDARRRAGVPFGEYEFALREPVRKVRLAATAWERALTSPSIVWMNALLGVGALEEEADVSIWNLAIGQWTHRWLGAMAARREGFSPRGDHDAAAARVAESAAAFRRNFEGVLRDLGRAPPDWWTSVWQQAACTARALAERLREAAGHTHIATEHNIEAAIALDGSRTLHVRGRIDVLLASAPGAGAAFPESVWIIDYKTGGKKSLAPKAGLEAAARRAVLAARLRQGDGLQLALYALAAHHLGATAPGVSLLTADLALDAPQITLDDVSPAAQAPLWSGLHRMQETGVFGARGRLRDDYSFADPHPLATLAIDPALLEEKWELTHPSIAGAEEDQEGRE